MNLSFKQIATWILNSASSRAILQKCFYWLVTWLCVIFCSKFLSVLFHTLFPIMNRSGWKQQVCQNGEKETYCWLWQRRKSWGLEGNVWRRRIFFLKLSDLLFIKQLPSFFSTELWMCPPDLKEDCLHFWALIKLFTLAVALLVYSFSILKLGPCSPLSHGKNNSDPKQRPFTKAKSVWIFRLCYDSAKSLHLFDYQIMQCYGGLDFFFLAIPKTCISVLCVTRHNQVWGSNLIGITLHFYIGRLGLGCIFFFISLTFNYLVRSRLAERVTWLDSSRWGSPCSCE